MRLLLLGATGLVGSTTLNQALAKDAISEVVAPTRRPLVPQNKLVNPVNLRLDELAPLVKSWNVDAVICAPWERRRRRPVRRRPSVLLTIHSLLSSLRRPIVPMSKRSHSCPPLELRPTRCSSMQGPKGGERHSANRLPLPYDLPTKHYRWREKRNADRRGCRFGYLASVSTHFAEKVSCQSGARHCGILARFSSHSETRLPVGFRRGVELRTHDSPEQKPRFEPGAPIGSRLAQLDGTVVGKSDIVNHLKEHSMVLSCFS
jgi:hypothetical protein